MKKKFTLAVFQYDILYQTNYIYTICIDHAHPICYKLFKMTKSKTVLRAQKYAFDVLERRQIHNWCWILWRTTKWIAHPDQYVDYSI